MNNSNSAMSLSSITVKVLAFSHHGRVFLQTTKSYFISIK